MYPPLAKARCCCVCAWALCCCWRELISAEIGRFQASSIEGNERLFDVMLGIGACANWVCKNRMRCDKFCGLPPLIVIVESFSRFFVLIVEFEIAGDVLDAVVGVVVPLAFGAGVELFWAAETAATTTLAVAVVELGFVVDDTVKF